MNIRSLKWRHWMALGVIAGVFVGTVRLMWDGEEPLGGTGFITQDLFEQALHAAPVDGHPYVTDIRIRPYHGVDGIDLVSLQAFDQDANGYKEYVLAAPRPFATRTGARREYSSVADYLKQLAATNPALRPRYAWSETTAAVLAAYALIGFIVIGVVWPLAIGVRRSRPPDPRFNLDRFHHDTAKTTPVNSEDHDQLRDLDQELEQAIEQGIERPAAVALSPESPVRQLSDVPLDQTVPEPEASKKDYAGQYYPVEKHAPHGFSLVELIVVIGIIALLIAFLMPAMRLVRMNAQTAKCAAQLRQIGQALHAYASANHNSLPAWSGWHTWPAGLPSDSDGPAWTIELIPYIGTPDLPVYNCPSFPLAEKYRNYFLESQWCGRSNRSSMKLSEITLPGKFVLSGDTTNMDHYVQDPKVDDADPDDFGRGMLLWPWTGGIYMHHGGDNVLFDDGHVALYSRFDKYSMTFNPRRPEDHDDVTPD
jgi:prepilin-type N-terminal cleavage/methylation domain-containing protein